MKAARIVPGPNGGRLQVMDVERPSPRAGEVIVRVYASALNRGEVSGMASAKSGNPMPAGLECAGIVEAVGDDVTLWKPGDEVMGHGRGTHQEFASLAEKALFRRPRTISWLEAAAFPNTFITVHDALVTHGGMKRGATVLVNAAPSGIGVAAIQSARALGAQLVIAVTRSAAKVDQLLKHGASHVVDSSKEGVAAAVLRITSGRGVDIVLDSVGGPAIADNIESAAIEGRVVQIGRLGGARGEIDLDRLAYRRVSLIGVTFRTRSEAERLACIEGCRRDLLPLLEAGSIRPDVARHFALEAIEEARQAMLSDSLVGKIVITLPGAPQESGD